VATQEEVCWHQDSGDNSVGWCQMALIVHGLRKRYVANFSSKSHCHLFNNKLPCLFTKCSVWKKQNSPEREGDWV